jgi:peptidoglycan/xylan/chitin deacetylase (PgdA/CDA1 family)
MRRSIISPWVLALVLIVSVPPAAPGPAPTPTPAVQALPRLAGVLPPVEAAILREFARAGLADRVVRIEAATNDRLTLARVSFTYGLRGVPDPLTALTQHVTAMARTALTGVPRLDGIHFQGFYHEAGWFNGRRRDPTFTAAYDRRDLPGLANTDRVWIHPALATVSPEALGAHTAARASLAQVAAELELSPAFAGTVTETERELTQRLEGLRRGGVRQGVLYRGDPDRRELALTFDDGPEALYTTLLLDTLDRLRLRATFFLVGQRVEQFPYLARDIARAGHELGNHSFFHRRLPSLRPEEIDEEIQATQAVVRRVTGLTPRFFRPPGGRYNAMVLRVAAARHLVTVFWTDDPADYAQPGEDVLRLRVLGRVTNGGILLLHTGIDQTIQVLPAVTGRLRERGFSLGPASMFLRETAR